MFGNYVAIWPGMKVHLENYDPDLTVGVPLVEIEGEPGWYMRADDAAFIEIAGQITCPRGGLQFPKSPEL